MKKLSEPAIVLNTSQVREADLIVTFLGKLLGKATAYAKNARGSKRRFAGGIDLFDCGVFELSANNRQEKMFSLQAITGKEVWPELRTNLLRLSLASFCLEVTDRFTVEGDPETSLLFNPLFLSLRSLSKTSNDSESYAIAVYFALLTLKQSGFNFLDADTPVGPTTRKWFEQMITQENPIIPSEQQLCLAGFKRLIRYIEKLLGHSLNTTINRWYRH